MWVQSLTGGGARVHSGTQSHRSTEGDSASHASHVHTGQPVVLLGSGRMHGRHWTAGPPSSAEARMLAPRGGASPGQSLGSWAVAPPPGVLEHSATTGPQMRGGGPRTTWGIVFAHSLLPPPRQRMPQPWADVACSPKHTHICPFGPRHQQEERGSWRKGRRPLPREGALPTLGVRAYMSVHCRASCRPAHFGTLAWALTCGCRWPSAAAGLVRSHTV